MSFFPTDHKKIRTRIRSYERKLQGSATESDGEFQKAVGGEEMKQRSARYEDKTCSNTPPTGWMSVCMQTQAAGKGANQTLSGKGMSRISTTDHRQLVSPAAIAGVR